MKHRQPARAWRRSRSPLTLNLVVLASALFVPGCGGEAGSERQAAESMSGQAPAAETAKAALTPRGPVDEALAERGEELFRAKGCVGCHTIGGGRLTGPDLQGVTDRREHGWVIAMITKPDSMLKNDATARGLFAEYMTPMLNSGVTPDEARALYEYLRYEAEGESEGDREHHDEHDGSK